MTNLCSFSMSNANIQMEITISDEALKLAKEWVKNMSMGDLGDNDDIEESDAPKLDIRPARLGLGAKYVPHSQLNATLNPIEKKLKAKIQDSKRNRDDALNKLKCDETDTKYDVSNEVEESKYSVFNKKDISKSFKSHLIHGSDRLKKRKTG